MLVGGYDSAGTPGQALCKYRKYRDGAMGLVMLGSSGGAGNLQLYISSDGRFACGVHLGQELDVHSQGTSDAPLVSTTYARYPSCTCATDSACAYTNVGSSAHV